MRAILGSDGIARDVEDDPAPGPLPEGCGIVIEGYPRSANSYVVQMFERSNPGVVVDHHNHSPEAVLRSLGERPVLVLIRDPVDACTSFCVYDPALGAGAALRRWIRFYTPLIGELGFSLVDFRTATGPLLGAAFEILGFDAPAAETWETLSRDVLADLRSRAGNGETGIRQAQAPRAGRRHYAADALQAVLRAPECPDALDLYEQMVGSDV